MAGLSSSAIPSGSSNSAASFLLSQTLSRDKLSLCSHIVAEHFGPIAGRVANVLLTRGRLSIPDLVYFLSVEGGSSSSGAISGVSAARGKSSSSAIGAEKGRTPSGGGISQRVINDRLRAGATALDASIGASATASASASSSSAAHPLAQPAEPIRKKWLIQHALMVLVQQNVCWHVRLDARGKVLNKPRKPQGKGKGQEHDEENDLVEGTEYFEMNPNEIIPRLRFGEYIGTAEDCFGSLGKEVVQLLLAHGKYRVDEIISQAGGESSTRRNRVENLLKRLLFSGYLLPSTLSSHISRREKEIAYETEYKDACPKDKDGAVQIRTPKQVQEMKAAIALRLQREETEAMYGKTSEEDMQNGGAGAGAGTRLRMGLRLKGGKHSYQNEREGSRSGLAETGRKRPNGSVSENGKGSSKRLKTSAGVSRRGRDEEDDDDEVGGENAPILSVDLDSYDIDYNIFLRVNYNRFDIHIRDHVLCDAMQDWLNHNRVAGQIFKTMLQVAEMQDEDLSCADTISRPFSLSKVENRLPDEVDLDSTFDQSALDKVFGTGEKKTTGKKKSNGAKLNGKANGKGKHKATSNGSSKKKRRRETSSEDEDSAEQDEDDSDRDAEAQATSNSALLREVLRHFLNAADPMGREKRFIIQLSGNELFNPSNPSAAYASQSTTLQIQFATICRRIKLEMLATMIAQVYGPEAKRIFNLLNVYGKLDEKNIKDLALMSLSETRKVCTDLFKASIIQVQEVPRTNDRKVERTIFLYFVDIERAYGWLLDRWYRTLEHLGRRRVMQDAKAWQIVQRIETRAAEDDPSQRPEIDALLRESEIATWEQLQKEREMLTTAEGKLQRDAFVLSSLPG